MRKSEDLAKLGQPPAGDAKKGLEPPPPKPFEKKQEVPSWHIPAGTDIKVKTTAGLSTRTANIGDRFPATVTQSISVEGEVVIPAGTEVSGLVFTTSDGTGLRRKVEMELRLVHLKLPGNRQADIRTLSIVADRAGATNYPVVIETGTELTFRLASEARIPKQ
jgi:hypothetical protein